MKSQLTFLFVFILFSSLYCQKNETIDNKLGIKKQYNYIQFDNSSLLLELLNGLISAKTKGFSIVHFGDSHIQAEGPTSVVRKNLHAQYGDAGKGMMFAYSAANTYNSVEYNTTHSGNWTFAKSFQSSIKLPLGISGMTVNTTEHEASLTFKLKQSFSHYRKVKLFVKRDSTCYDFRLITNSDTVIVKTYNANEKAPFIDITIPPNTSVITIELLKNNPIQNQFEFYGMSLETANFKGVIYHSVGVGAAKFGSILSQQLLKNQLPVLTPNLLILDFGTNDYLYDNHVKTELGPQIEQIIENLREIAPNALILLTSTQDLFYKSQPITAGIVFRNLIDSLAKKNHCLFWDWYAVSGGKKSLIKWKNADYAQGDLIHLTNKGYELKGQLLYEAIQNSIDSITKKPNITTLNLPYDESAEVIELAVVNKDEIKPLVNPDKITVSVNKESAPKPTITKKEPEKKKQSKTKYHTVKKGDTLFDIAKKYKTTVSKIKKANNLKSDNLRAGQKLKIP